MALFNHGGIWYHNARKNHEVLVLISADSPQRFQGIARLAGECGWHIRTERRAVPPKEWSGDGLLTMLDGSRELMAFARRIRQRGIPIVDLMEQCPSFDAIRVTGDDREIGSLAAQHFNERDFKHAAFFSVLHNHTHDLRLDGFRHAWNGSTIESWIWPDATGGSRDDWRGMDTWLVTKLRSAQKPLAVFAWNDYDATHVLNACRLAELKVPDEVAILGVDNNPVICEHQSVHLSSIAHDHERIGYTAAATLERMMCGGIPSRPVTRIKPSGVVARESTETFAVYDKNLMPAIEFIKRNLAHPLGAAQIAAALNMPRIRLDRMFAARLGHSAGAEIARRRIAEAKRLLLKTDLPLSGIASRCGYCHASFFIKSFKKATGLTPQAWRRRESPSNPSTD